MKVLEKFQNKKVFALYLVGVLLLSAGVSFAYFSANSSVTGGGSVATNTTATIQGKGTVEVKLTRTDSNGGNWSRTQTVNFNSATTINFS